MDFLPLCEQKKETLLRHRRYLHRHPELTGQEINTIRYIDETLTQAGIPHVVVENGGVLGFLRTGKNRGKTVLLRADCDALPIQEDPKNAKAPKTCVSLVPGVQHACGHDAHTACLLTAAEILWEHREEVPGDIIFCFERGEEGGGNLYYLLKYMEDHHIRVDGCFGLHVLAGGRTGAALLTDGPLQAGNIGFSVTLYGNGGHGSMPSLCHNPIDCFAAISAALSQLRLQAVDPYQPATLSIGCVHAGQAGNVIPDTLQFSGTARFYHETGAGEALFAGIHRIVDSCCALYGCTAEKRISRPGLSVINPHPCYEIACRALTQALGENRVQPWDAMMGSESFAYYSKLYPSFFLFYSIRNEEKGITIDCHKPGFDIDEDTLPGAAACHMAYALAFLQNPDPIPFTPLAGCVDDLFERTGRRP